MAEVKNFFLANFEDVANTPDFVTLPEVRMPVILQGYLADKKLPPQTPNPKPQTPNPKPQTLGPDADGRAVGVGPAGCLVGEGRTLTPQLLLLYYSRA